MTDEINLSRLDPTLESHAYPADREALAASFAGTTMLFADGDADLGDPLADVDRETLGEPGQSDGDA